MEGSSLCHPRALWAWSSSWWSSSRYWLCWACMQLADKEAEQETQGQDSCRYAGHLCRDKS